jgi:hypothetical protein
VRFHYVPPQQGRRLSSGPANARVGVTKRKRPRRGEWARGRTTKS